MTPKEYIDLYLEKISDNGKSKQFVLGEILEQSQANVIVILGAPGSGKSAILKKYQSEMADIAELTTVKQFIKLDKTTDKPILLLDGLDEFRSTSNDKVFVISKLGSKISKLKDKRIVVTCREMDWYGEDDKYALRDEINSEVDVYRILPLSYDKQIEFASKLGLDEPKVFVDSLTEKGLIGNPQMLGMMADIFVQYGDLASIGKGELYRRYVLYAREHNKNFTRNDLNILSEEEIFKLGGYLAIFYVFSNIDIFDEAMLDEVPNVDFPLDRLKTVLGSKLFSEQKFSHRTIAEFLAGNYMAKYLLEASDGVGIERVKALFVSEDKIPTELRGTFAWLCSISKNTLLIQIDPYYQAMHGDNSLFAIEQKKDIVLSVRQYAENSPYFYKFNHSLDLQGFYDSRLEEFFAAELQDAVRMQNHYIYFICAILKGASELGDGICSVIKENIIDSSVADYDRDNLIYALNDEDDFLLEVLNKIKDGELDDDNDHLKEALLNKLYPDVVDSKSVSQYLQLYHTTERGGGCYFLMKTPYSEKKDLVDEIHGFSVGTEQNKKHLIIHDTLKQFVDEYFLETALMYEDALSAEAIYAILKYFKNKYYGDYESIEFNRYGWSLKQKINDAKMQKLANELFSLYAKDKIGEKGKRYHFFEFINRLFSLQAPNNQYETLSSLMNEKLDGQINEDLFFAALAYSKRDENNTPIDIDRIKKIAKQYALDDALEVWLKPPKTDWQIEDEREMAERAKKDKETLEANDAYFAARSDEEIQGSFGDLHWFSGLVYFEKEQIDTKLISTDVYDRLRKIFKNAIFAELIEPELLTIEQLAQNKGNRRNIDRAYYASLALNNDEGVFGGIPNDSFLKYLYISSLLSSHIGNINRSNFHERVSDSFATETLREYIEYLVSANLPDIADMVIKYANATDNLDALQTVAMSREFNNTGFDSAFFKNFLDAFNFSIIEEDLGRLKKYAEGNNKTTIDALEYFANDSSDVFSMSMAVAMYEIFTHNNFYTFKNYEKRVAVVSKMMEAFNTEESIKSVNGFQSQRNVCASFLSHDALKALRLDEYEFLLKNHQNDVWANRIKNAIDDDKQQEVDANGYGKLDVVALKEFLQSQAIVSVEDFFADVCIRLETLVKKIEDNRDNEKNLFYSDSKAKNENECRDAITNILSHAYKDPTAQPNPHQPPQPQPLKELLH